MSVKILIDSATDLTAEEAAALNVGFLPIYVKFGEEEYADGVDLTHERFFEMLIEGDEFPKTSQINEFRFEEMFASLTSDGSEVVAITLSSKLSGTYFNAVKAAKKFNGKVFVIDSLNAAIGERIIFEYAYRLKNEGKTASEIFKEVEEKKNKVNLLALLGTLKYLEKGGRISKATAVAGTLLNVKPVVSVIGGEVKLVGKAVGSKKGNNLLMQKVALSGGIDFTMPFGVAYSGLDDSVLKKYLADSAPLWQDNCKEVPSYMIGSTIGAHVGPGAIAVAYFAK